MIALQKLQYLFFTSRNLVRLFSAAVVTKMSHKSNLYLSRRHFPQKALVCKTKSGSVLLGLKTGLSSKLTPALTQEHQEEISSCTLINHL